MSIDQTHSPNDLPQLNPNRSLFTPYHSAAYLPSSSTGDPISSDEAADDQPSRRKVKLLCSFGGKILRRPSDGALRYAGGQTRIIAVRRDVTLSELYRKMADAYGGPVAIRYQLPDEDIDALVTVSSSEDLDNMMDEYDKLAEASVDGSAKLRVFLFSQVEIASVLAENISSRHALIDPYDSGQKYIEAVNGCVVSEANTYAGEVRLKSRTASAASIQNSDTAFDGSNNEGTSPTVLTPSSGASAFFDKSNLAFVSTATSVPLQESQFIPANSAVVVGQTIVPTHHSNPPQAVPYPSQAFVETHQVHFVPPHSLNVATPSLMVNGIPVSQHTYLPPTDTAPASIPTQVGSMKPVLGQANPFSGEGQFSGTFIQPLSDPNYTGFQQPLSQIPPLQPSHLQPTIIEQYELHLVPPLPNGQRLRFEDCQMCQKSLPHVHSDGLINEIGDVPGISMPNARQMLRSHHSDDAAWLQGQPRIVGVAMTDSLEPKDEHTVKPDQNGTCGVDRAPNSVLDLEKFFMTTAETIDQSKLIPQAGTVGLTGDTRASFGVLLTPPQSHIEASFHQQQKQVLHGETFHASKFLHPMATSSLSSSGHSNGVYCNQQNHYDDYLQQLNVQPDISADCNQDLRSSGTIGLSSIGETSYGTAVIVPSRCPVNQVVTGNQCSRAYAVNANYNAVESLSQAQGDIKQVDGIMEALNVGSLENLRSKGQLKPTVVPITDVSRDTKPESLFMIGDNQSFGPQNGGNALLSCNAFSRPTVGPEGVFFKSVNPAVSNTTISREIRPESSSLVGEENNMVKSIHCGNKVPSSNAFVSPGILPKENLVNPLLSTAMDLQIFELGIASRVSTMTGSSVHSQNFERNAIHFPSNQQFSGMSPYIADSACTSTVTKRTSGAWADEICQVQRFASDLTAPQRDNPQVPLSSSIVLGHDDQFQEIFSSGSLLGNENHHDIIQSMYTFQPRTAAVDTREPTILGDTSNDNYLRKDKFPDIEVLLEEGILHPPIDWLMKDSHPDPVMAMKESEAHFIKQDLCESAKQDEESVPQSSIPPAYIPSFSGSKDLSPLFFGGTGLHEDNSNSQSAAIQGDRRIEDIKVKPSDKLRMGLPPASDIGRLQIIKNCDLEELRELGSGTFGTVYHGKWRGSDVAIKRINDRCFTGKPSEQEKMRGDFWNEASKLADLHHPNVVAFYGVVLDGPGGSYATVTEYMINGSLRNVLQTNDKSFDRRKCLLIAMDVAFGMEYLHGKNIVHFDLKSDNLLVNLRDPQRPICKVGDLGLSKVKCQTLISGGVRGTLPWMAPELLNGSSNLVSDKVDVFSFGIVMWELLTGEEPYSDLHYGTIIGGIVSNTLRPPVPENCDSCWRALMEQCWSAVPSERPSFTEIANRLRAMAGSLPQKAKASK